MKLIKYTYPVISIILSFIVDIEILGGLLFVYFVNLHFSDKRMLYKLKSKYLLSFFVVLLIFYPLTGSRNDISLPFGLNYDLTLVVSSIRLIFRALFLMLLFNQLILNVKSLNIQRIGKKIGFSDFDEIMRISEELLPHIKSQFFILINDIKNGSISVKSPSNLIAIFLSKLLIQKNQI